MPKGRPRKFPQEKLLEGSRAKIQVEVFAPHGAPFVPEHLNDDAQACAEHIIRSFSTKHISGLDSYCLAVFAAAWAWHKAAVHEMSSPGFKADLAHGIIGVPGASFQKPAR
jgi:phage terminase small subunit